MARVDPDCPETAESLGTRIRRDFWPRRGAGCTRCPNATRLSFKSFTRQTGCIARRHRWWRASSRAAWREVRINLPAGAGAAPLRIDFMRALDLVEIAQTEREAQRRGSISPRPRRTSSRRWQWRGMRNGCLTLSICASGSRVIDPQLVLPRLEIAPDDERLRVEMRLQVLSEP